MQFTITSILTNLAQQSCNNHHTTLLRSAALLLRSGLNTF